MPTFKACVFEHQMRKDGKYRISIRLTHNRQSAYIRTDTYLERKNISKDFKTIKSTDILRRIDRDILRYEELLLKGLGTNLKKYTARELVNYITIQIETEGGANIDYIAEARIHIHNLISEGRASYAQGFKTVIGSLTDYFGREVVYVREITVKMLRAYVEYIMKPRTITRLNQFGIPVTVKKQGVGEQTASDYITKLQIVFNTICNKYNDPDGELDLITHNPFRNFHIKVTAEPAKRNLSVEDLIKIIQCTDASGRMGLARDVFMLSFYLIGINTSDLYTSTIKELSNGRLTYQRNKTKNRRKDEATMSVKIEPEAELLIAKYRDPAKKRTFDFYRRYADCDTFNAAVNKGLKQLARHLQIEAKLSTYYARHTYATIAANKCNISESDVGLLLNHVGSGTDRHEARSIKITRGYIGRDWSKIDVLHRKVLNFVKDEFTPRS